MRIVNAFIHLQSIVLNQQISYLNIAKKVITHKSKIKILIGIKFNYRIDVSSTI